MVASHCRIDGMHKQKQVTQVLLAADCLGELVKLVIEEELQAY